MARAWPGARVGWQRQRAWMEVFSSAQTTKSPGPNGRPSQSPGVQVQHAGGLDREVRVPHRDPGPVLPRLERVLRPASGAPRPPRPLRWQRMASSRAISGQLHRDSGTSCSAGNAHANATASARTAGPCTGGRPLRGRSVNDSSRSPVAVAKRPRHRRTASTPRGNCAAISALDPPRAAARTIWARNRSRYAVRPEATRAARVGPRRRSGQSPTDSTSTCGSLCRALGPRSATTRRAAAHRLRMGGSTPW